MNETPEPQTGRATNAPGAAIPPDAGTGAPPHVVVVAAPQKKPLVPRNYLWLAGAAVALVVAMAWLGPILTPFLVGAVFAYLGTPVMTWASRRNIPRGVAATVIVGIFGLLVMGLLIVLIPLIQSEFALAIKRLPDLAIGATARISAWMQQTFDVSFALDAPALKAYLAEHMEEARELTIKLLPAVKTGGLILISVLVNLALIPVVMFYLLRDGKMIALRADDLLPRHWQDKTRTILKQIDAVLAEFVRGQLMVMVVLAVYYAVGLSIAGLDRAVAIGILTGLLVFIPYVGFGLGLILGVLAAVLQWSGWPAFIAVLSVYGIGQLLENYVLVPWLVGDRIGLHPLAVIFSLLAFGHLFGFAGVLMALPVSAAILVGLRHLKSAYVDSPVYRGYALTGRVDRPSPMEQLTFELAAPAPPTFANYVSAGNAEAVTMLGRVVMPTWRETCVVLWGAPGGGKTHLLRAAVSHAETSLPAIYYPAPEAVPDELPVGRALIAVDDVDRAGPGAQGRLFTLFNALAATGGCLVAAASVPPARMPLRDDLRSRLGWGLVFEIVALADSDKVAALGAYARSLGLELAPDVIGYLLAHGRRDMSSLVTTIAALDRHSLATKRAVTVPLLREWLQRGLPNVRSP